MTFEKLQELILQLRNGGSISMDAMTVLQGAVQQLTPKQPDTTKPMGMVELVTKIGDNNITFQNLDSSMISVNYDHKKTPKTRITFGTDQIPLIDTLPMLGLVLWLNRGQVDKIIEARKAGVT